MKNCYLNHIICTLLFLAISLFFMTTYTNSEGTGKIQGKAEMLGNRGVADAIVFVKDLIGDFAVPEERLVMNQINEEFIPHVLPVLKGATVDFLNSDEVWHNVNSHLDESVTHFNLGDFPPGLLKLMKFDDTGVVPIECSIHPRMQAYVIVLDNPFFSISSRKGSFVIENVPAGEYYLDIWHEKKSADKQIVKVQSGKTVIVNFKLR